MNPVKFQNATTEDIPAEIQALLDMLPDKSNEKRGIYIHGGVGIGKTHILYAIEKYLLERRHGCFIINAVDLLFDIKKDFDRLIQDKQQPLEFILTDPRLLLLDDLGSEKPTEWVQETFYHIINRRYVENRTIIITSNHAIQELAEHIGDRTTSRIIEMCNIVEMSGKDRRIQNPNKISIKV